MVKNKVYEFVCGLTAQERSDIISSFEKFEEDGMIGEEACRVYARKLLEYLGVQGDSMIVTWMNSLSFECYRYYYHN